MKRLAARPDASRYCSRRRIQAAGAAIVISVVLGACSSSGSPASGAPASSPSTPSPSSPGQTEPSVFAAGVIFHGKIQVTGALKLATKFTEKVTAVTSCTDVPTKGDAPGRTFRVPSAYAGQYPQIDIQVARFHGAGTYPPSQLQGDKSDTISLKVGGVTNEYEITFHPAAPNPAQAMGKEVLFLDKNGAGELAFSEAHQLGQKSRPAIAGLITWTCTPAKSA